MPKPWTWENLQYMPSDTEDQKQHSVSSSSLNRWCLPLLFCCWSLGLALVRVTGYAPHAVQRANIKTPANLPAWRFLFLLEQANEAVLDKHLHDRRCHSKLFANYVHYATNSNCSDSLNAIWCQSQTVSPAEMVRNAEWGESNEFSVKNDAKITLIWFLHFLVRGNKQQKKIRTSWNYLFYLTVKMHDLRKHANPQSDEQIFGICIWYLLKVLLNYWRRYFVDGSIYLLSP